MRQMCWFCFLFMILQWGWNKRTPGMIYVLFYSQLESFSELRPFSSDFQILSSCYLRYLCFVFLPKLLMCFANLYVNFSFSAGNEEWKERGGVDVRWGLTGGVVSDTVEHLGTGPRHHLARAASGPAGADAVDGGFAVDPRAWGERKEMSRRRSSDGAGIKRGAEMCGF